ncbi:unnamed protein product [Caenorhabditis angaria]|uniref:Uncharacterized protein n=1 Tax=Caenorhabditis angaria TaxID=860376 RepID=A0A9P1N3C2_9PELO|nr:unnamed protein product [Caenorhabditis angaria]
MGFHLQKFPIVARRKFAIAINKIELLLHDAKEVTEERGPTLDLPMKHRKKKKKRRQIRPCSLPPQQPTTIGMMIETRSKSANCICPGDFEEYDERVYEYTTAMHSETYKRLMIAHRNYSCSIPKHFIIVAQRVKEDEEIRKLKKITTS